MTEEKNTEEKNVVRFGRNGEVQISNQRDLSKAANLLIQLNLAPKHLVDKGVAAVAAALATCKSKRLPQTAMNQMAYIHGKVTCYGSLITALAEMHPNYGEKKVFYVDEKQDEICFKNKNLGAEVWGCVILAKTKNDTEWSEYYYTKPEAEKAGLLYPKKKEYLNGRWTGEYVINKESPWIKYPKDMYYHKANKRMISDKYSSALEGVDYHEDVKEVYEAMRDVTPKDEQIEKMKNDIENLGSDADSQGASDAQPASSDAEVVG